jgi:hypothetical protein
VPSAPKTEKTLGGVGHPVGALVRWLASLKLTIVLLVLLAAALACAHFLEAARGREYAQWYVYGSHWFIGLLGALAANIAAAALARFPWRWSRSGPVIALVGLLVLLAGFIQTLVRGIEGRLILRQGEAAQTVLLTRRSQLTLLSPRGKDVQSTELCFSPGPADWGSDEPLDFGGADGMAVQVLRFYRHARYQAEWVADEAGLGRPAIQVAVSGPQGRGSGEGWWVPNLIGSPPVAGVPEVSIQQASVASLRDDFLKPPPVKPGSRGLLSVHYKDRVYPIPVDGNTSKSVPVGDSGLTVEIAEYYANAKSAKEQFISEGAEPKNPMLRLRVHVPGQKKPISEIAYANQPFVNFESIKKQECPVKFWYHHPAASAASGAEFLQTPDGKLYCRVGAGGACQPRGEVKPGDRVTASDGRQISLLGYIPHARRQGTFVPVELAPGETTEAEAAALVELTTADRSEQFWLGRNDAQLGVRRLLTPGGPRIVTFGYERRPLGFSVKLADFHRDTNPNATSDAWCVSHVYLSEGTEDPDVIPADDSLRTISTNSPLRYGTFTFYQYGFQQLPGGVDLSVLRVTSDPGRLWKYLGGAMLCVGILVALCLRGLAFPYLPNLLFSGP